MDSASSSVGDVFPPSTVLRVFYSDSGEERSLTGRYVGQTDDGAFLIFQRPLGDKVLIAKAANSAIQVDMGRGA